LQEPQEYFRKNISKLKQGGGMTKKKENVLDLALATEGAKQGYDIALSGGVVERSADADDRMAAAGFSNDQAQLAYTLAEEIVAPAIARIAAKFKAARELERLEAHFGGEDRFDEVARQIASWASKNIDAETFDALASSYIGVISMFNMMSSGEPEMARGTGSRAARLCEGKLKDMMRDPRYWRDNDQAFIKSVEDGFKSLYSQSAL
jgi:hypothetical protein